MDMKEKGSSLELAIELAKRKNKNFKEDISQEEFIKEINGIGETIIHFPFLRNNSPIINKKFRKKYLEKYQQIEIILVELCKFVNENTLNEEDVKNLSNEEAEEICKASFKELLKNL